MLFILSSENASFFVHHSGLKEIENFEFLENFSFIYK